jgi:hypothetical protein
MCITPFEAGRASDSSDTSDMGKHTVERPRHVGKVQRVDEQGCVLHLSAATGAEEAPKLLLIGLPLLRGLLLEGPERSKLPLSIDDPYHGGRTERADQLVLQVRDAHEETESLHIRASEVGAEAGSLEAAPEVALFCRVAESRQSDVKPFRAEPIQEAPNVLRTSHWYDGDALSVKIPTTALSERRERELVADPFNQHDSDGFLLACSIHATARPGTPAPRAGGPCGSLTAGNRPPQPPTPCASPKHTCPSSSRTAACPLAIQNRVYLSPWGYTRGASAPLSRGGTVLGTTIVIPGIIVLILIVLLVVWLLRRA